MLNEISLEIIQKCPNACLHCSSMSGMDCIERLDYGHFSSVVNDAAKLGAKTICLSGGEPFLHDRLVDMVRLTSSMGLQTYIYTSGIMLDGEGQPAALSQSILSEISPYITKLIFNIEAADPRTYDAIMGTEGCFELMQQSVRRARSLSIVAEANFVPMKLNIDQAEAVVAMCQRMDISKINFLRLVLHGRAQANADRIALPDQKLEELKMRLQDLQAHASLNIRIGVPLSTQSEDCQCEAAQGKLNIRYDGLVFPCEVFKNGRVTNSLAGCRPGSIYEEPLAGLYDSSPYLRRVRELARQCPTGCETCIGQYLMKKEAETNGC